MLVLWLTGLIFVVAIRPAWSGQLPRARARVRDNDGHLRVGPRPVSVSAKDSPLHINRFPMNKRGHESTMMRRSPNGVYFVPDENIVDLVNAKRGNVYKTQPDVQTIQLVLDDDESDTAKSLEHSKRGLPVKPYDVEKLLAQLASYRGNVKALVQDRHRAIFKSKLNRQKGNSNKKFKNTDNLKLGDIEAIIKKALGKEPKRPRKKIHLKSLPEDASYDKKFATIPSDVLEAIKAVALKEILGGVMKAGLKRTKPNLLDSWNKNSLYVKGESQKRERAQSSPFNGAGMLYITKPKGNQEPNLSALLGKVAGLQRAGAERSHTSVTDDFSPDEMKRIDMITRAIENDDRTFERVDETIERLDQLIVQDDLNELQKLKDKKSVRSKDTDSDKYLGRIADLVNTDRDSVDPTFEFDTLVA